MSEHETCKKCEFRFAGSYLGLKRHEKAADCARDWRESYMMASECLGMVHEVIASLDGEEKAKGVAAMFYPEAIRSLMFRAAKGEFDDRIPRSKIGEVLEARRLLATPLAPGAPETAP